MESRNLKKLLSGISVFTLLAGVGSGVGGCASTANPDAAEVKHPTRGSLPVNISG